MATLAELLVPQTVEQTFNQLIALATQLGFPTSSWQPGGTERARLLMFATVLSNLSSDYIPGLAAGGLTKLSTGLWLDLLSENNYNITRNPATQTEGLVTLSTEVSNAGPYVITDPQSFYIVFPDGLRYYNKVGFTIPSDGYIAETFVSEFAVDTLVGLTYNEGSNQPITMLTPLPGVVITNPEQEFSDITQQGLGQNGLGTGTGTITLSGTPIAAYFVIIKVDIGGESGGATWSYSLDGSNFSDGYTNSSLELFDGPTDTGVLVTLVNGSPTPSFSVGDTYIFATFQSWITVQGADKEADIALQNRDIDSWNALSGIPTQGYYEKLVQEVPTVGSQVTQVIVEPDGYVNDKVNIVIAGPNGALPADTIALVQTYVSQRITTTEYPVVYSPGTIALPVTLNIQVSVAQYQTLYGTDGTDGLVGDLIGKFIKTTPINGLLRVFKLSELLMELIGVIDINSITINGSFSNYQLGTSTTYQVATWDSGGSTLVFIRV